MQVEYKTTIGTDEFTVRVEVQDGKEFFEKLSFFTTLPKVGPSGETDLKLTYAHTQDGYDYYSLVSEQAGQEFKYGQRKTDGALFPKGWAPLYQGDSGQQAQTQESTQRSTNRFKVKSRPIVSQETDGEDDGTEYVATPVPTPVVAKTSSATAPATTTPPKRDLSQLMNKYGLKAKQTESASSGQ